MQVMNADTRLIKILDDFSVDAVVAEPDAPFFIFGKIVDVAPVVRLRVEVQADCGFGRRVGDAVNIRGTVEMAPFAATRITNLLHHQRALGNLAVIAEQ